MMKCLYTLLLFAMMATATAQAAPSAVEQANKAYGDELYTKALELYLGAEKTQGTSSQLCYNIGNTYYRLKDVPHAILYYERALILDPSNGDARFNLEFVREKSAISEDNGDTYFSTRFEGFVSSLSSNTWAVIGIVSFVLFLLAVAAYLFGQGVTLRKVGFFGGAFLIVLTVVANVCAFYMHSKAVNRNTAIVMAAQTQLSTSPRTPKDKSEVAFEMTEGYKVTITDSVKSQGTLWYNIETVDLKNGWINSKDIEII